MSAVIKLFRSHGWRGGTAFLAAVTVNAGLAAALLGLGGFGPIAVAPARPLLAPVEVAWLPAEPREPEPTSVPRSAAPPKAPAPLDPPTPTSASEDSPPDPPPLSLGVTLDLPDLPPLLVDPAASITGLDLDTLTVRRPAATRRTVRRTAMRRGPMHERGVDVPPGKLFAPQPAFPRLALKRNIGGGTVKAKLLVTAAGRVARVKILGATPAGYFERSVESTVRDWTFTAARYRGKAVDCWYRQTFQFRMEGR